MTEFAPPDPNQMIAPAMFDERKQLLDPLYVPKYLTKSEYDMPADQIQAEMNLVEGYKDSPLRDVLAVNLENLKRFAGIAIPQFKYQGPIAQRDPTAVPSPEFTEDIGGGMVDFGSTNGPGDIVQMWLTPALEKISQEEFDSMSSVEQAKYMTGQYGMTVNDGYSRATARMLEDIYSLIGAKKVRDETNDPGGRDHGTKLYEGTYMDTPVYIKEVWSTFRTGAESRRVQSVYMLGKEAGQVALHQLTASDIGRLEAVGFNPYAVRGHGINRSNMDQHIATAQEINGLFDHNPEA